MCLPDTKYNEPAALVYGIAKKNDHHQPPKVKVAQSGVESLWRQTEGLQGMVVPYKYLLDV